MTRATGIGSWPGLDPGAALGAIRHLLADDQLPYLPELPARGPGADLIGRGAAILTDLPVELAPSGWRHTDAPGRDASRARGFLRHDLDSLAETFDGYVGDLKIQLAGPWTLAAAIELPRGERTLTDGGAVSDLIASLADGAVRHARQVADMVPGARVIVQVDEPSLPSVLAGRLPTASGYGRVRAVDPQRAATGLGTVLEALAAFDPIVHCCDHAVPLPLLRRAGARGVALDLAGLTSTSWESLAATVEEGVQLYAGCLRPDGTTSRAAAVESLTRPWRDVGLEVARLDEVLVTAACGIPALSFDEALALTRRSIEVAAELTDLARA